MHTEDVLDNQNIGGFFDNLDEYIYISKEIAQNITTDELVELEKIDKHYEKLPHDYMLVKEDNNNESWHMWIVWK